METETRIWIVDGKPVLNPHERPSAKFRLWETFKPELDAWFNNCVEAENAHISQHSIEGHDEITILKPVFQIVTPGSKVIAKGNVVKQIL